MSVPGGTADLSSIELGGGTSPARHNSTVDPETRNHDFEDPPFVSEISIKTGIKSDSVRSLQGKTVPNSDDDKLHPTIEECDGSIFGKWKFSKERTAWYIYDVANTVIFGAALNILLPSFLTKMAELRAYGDGKVPEKCDALADAECTDLKCFSKGTSMPYEAQCTRCIPSQGNVIWNGVNGAFENTDQFKVPFFGIEIPLISFASAVVMISVLFQAFFFISFGPFADHGNNRKNMLIITTVLGGISFISFIFAPMGPDGELNGYIIAGILTVVANVIFGLSVISYNAYMPLLVSANATVKNAPPPRNAKEQEKQTQFYAKHEAEMSSRGFIAGNIGQVIGLVMCVVIFLRVGDKSSNGYLATRICLAFCGIWWVVFALPSFIYLKQRPGPAFPQSVDNMFKKCFFGWKAVRKSISHARKFKYTFRFLIIYFIYSDVVSTLGSLIVLFALKTHCFTHFNLLIFSFIVMISSTAGVYFYLWIRRLCASTKAIVIINVSVYGLLSLWALIGLTNNTFGVVSKAEIYVFGFIMGFHVGPVLCFSRVMYSELIPIGHESTFFSLYEITDKGSSWLGPLIITGITATGASERYVFFYLFAMSVLSILVLWRLVDHGAGMIDCGRTKAISGSKNGHYDDMEIATQS